MKMNSLIVALIFLLIMEETFAATKIKPVVSWENDNVTALLSQNVVQLNLTTDKVVNSDLTISLSLAGTAKVGSDFTLSPGTTVKLPKNSKSTSLSITIIRNNGIVTDKTIQLTITNISSSSSKVVPSIGQKKVATVTIKYPGPDLTPPTIPTGIKSSSASLTSIGLNWIASTDNGASGIKNYKIYQDGQYVGSTIKNETTFLLNGLSSGTYYFISITAVDNSNNESAKSEEVRLSTSNPPVSANCPGIVTPKFSAYSSNNETAELVVSSALIAKAHHYEITRTESNGKNPVRLLPLEISPSTTSLTDNNQGIINGVEYSYSLTVVNWDGSKLAAIKANFYDVARKAPYVFVGVAHKIGTTFDQKTFGDGFPAPINQFYAKYFNFIRDPISKAVLPCSTVQIIDSVTKKSVNLYADRFGKFPLNNPIQADSFGRFEFYAENGLYDFQIKAPLKTFTLSKVVVFDPRSPYKAKAENSAAMTLVMSEAPTTSEGNFPAKFIKKGWEPFRLLAHDSLNSWGMALNAGWNEISKTWTLDVPTHDSSIIRVNQETKALEYALDQSQGPIDPITGNYVSRKSASFETLFHFGLSRTHFKNLHSPKITIDAIAAESGIVEGSLVHFNSDGTVSLTRGKEMNPFVVARSDEPVSKIGSVLKIVIAGNYSIRMRGKFKIGDPVVSSEDGYGEAAPLESDSRFYVGRAANEGGSNSDFSDLNTLIIK